MSFDAGSLLASMLVSSIGFALFSYGKKQHRFPHSAVGVVMMLYPYAVSSVSAMLGIGAGLVVLLAALVRMGI